MTIILFFLLIIVYLTIGKVIVKLLEEYAIVDDFVDDSFRGFAAIFFPITLICVFIGKITEKLSDLIILLFNKN